MKNKKGFISMTLVYTFLILFLFLLLSILAAYNRKNGYLETIDLKIKKEVKLNTEGLNTNKTYRVRYIKDCINGDTVSVNIINHWVELQAIKDGVNLALNKSVVGTSPENITYPYSRITDGSITTTNYAATSSKGLQCVTVDLEQNYYLDEIAVWHYWGDGRTYYSNTIYISSDNNTWIPIMADESPETSTGKRILASNISEDVIPIYRTTNLITNGSFENGTTEWTFSTGVSQSNAKAKYGTYSARNYHAAQYLGATKARYSDLTNAITAYANHIYYASNWLYTINRGNEYCYSTLDFIYDSADHWDRIGALSGDQTNLNVWEKFSEYRTMPDVTDPLIGLATASSYSTNALQECYADGVMVIDLTATFGIGNEPSIEWCDENIDYFNGATNFYLSP